MNSGGQYIDTVSNSSRFYVEKFYNTRTYTSVIVRAQLKITQLHLYKYNVDTDGK